MKHFAQTAGIPKACEICNCSNDSIQSGKFWPARSDLTLANYAEVLQINGLIGFLVNSVVIATCTTLLAVFVGSLAAYALSRFALHGKPIFMKPNPSQTLFYLLCQKQRLSARVAWCSPATFATTSS